MLLHLLKAKSDTLKKDFGAIITENYLLTILKCGIQGLKLCNKARLQMIALVNEEEKTGDFWKRYFASEKAKLVFTGVSEGATVSTAVEAGCRPQLQRCYGQVALGSALRVTSWKKATADLLILRKDPNTDYLKATQGVFGVSAHRQARQSQEGYHG